MHKGGIVIQFPGRVHDRASAGSSETAKAGDLRAASAAMTAAVTPAPFAVGVSKIDCHHSSGMRSRWDHLRTADTPALISAAISSGEAQSPIIARNEFSGSVMESYLGQFVLNGKAILSPDCGDASGQNCPMETKAGKSEFNKAFQGRMRTARRAAGYSQAVMADLLEPGMVQDKYKQYETRAGSYLPHDLVPRFCKICHIKIADLYGTRDQIQKPPKAPGLPKKPAVKEVKKRVA